jgi:hypothetical protein
MQLRRFPWFTAVVVVSCRCTLIVCRAILAVVYPASDNLAVEQMGAPEHIPVRT